MGMAKVLGSAARATQLQFQEINKPFQYAIENSIEHVFVPGDISDIARLGEDEFSNLVMLLLSWDQDINTYYIRGNHDVEHKFKSSLDVLQLLCDAGVFKRFKLISQPDTIKIDGVYTSFLPWGYFEAPKASRPRLMFAHIETVGAIGDNGRPMIHGNEEQVKRGPQDFIISGHIHQYQHMKKKRLIYNGNLFQKNFGESLPKGWVEFEARYKDEGTRLVVDHKFITNRPNFTLEHVLIEKQEDWEKLKKDPSIRYKVLVDKNAGVLVPKGLNSDYPNIVMFKGFDPKKESVDEAVREVGVGFSAKDLPKFNPLSGLKRFTSKQGLDKAQFKRARNYVLEAMREIQHEQAR